MVNTSRACNLRPVWVAEADDHRAAVPFFFSFLHVVASSSLLFCLSPYLFCLYHWVRHIPWPHLVPAWDVWLGIARLVPAQRFQGTGRRKHSVVYHASSDDKKCFSALNHSVCSVFQKIPFEWCFHAANVGSDIDPNSTSNLFFFLLYFKLLTSSSPWLKTLLLLYPLQCGVKFMRNVMVKLFSFFSSVRDLLRQMWHENWQRSRLHRFHYQSGLIWDRYRQCGLFVFDVFL